MIGAESRLRPAAGDSAVMKAAPEDFRVEELAGFRPEGDGEHLYLRLEKRGLSTPDVAAWLARAYRVQPSAVGYAGMKDKHGITEQWFSVCTPLDGTALPARQGIRLCAATRHARKLRRGQLAGNRFRIRLRDATGETWATALAAVRDRGVANFFGPQRFGHDNLERARQWLTGRRRRRGRTFRSGLYLSVLRSFLFNEVLAVRVDHDCWDRLLPGDVPVALPASPEPAPSGPLWGRGRSSTDGEALVLEQQALAAHAALCHGLEHAGLTQQRRSLVLKAPDLRWEADGRTLEVGFTLPPGGYATTLLGAVFHLSQPVTAP